ncbi:diguanylate cyclase [Thalassotalea sp. LPB0316]|uniref:sensor domain-containing diguanylate cyclase n=1 Tax=Thalassotalea sp. LPB0316 TaxID=2769490 RepID=UPI00186752BE|nr:diguanylate cyclase [Thalassotalea sp. LPB0316]QOL24500.1 diguanylate cyclase [Thalassotalea sp. LPB0316]
MSLETEQINEIHWLMEMLHTIDVGLVVLDRDYNVQIWNGFMEHHSGLLPRQVKNKNLFTLFDDIDEQWFTRKAEAVFLLKNKAFTIWEQRPYLFKFQNYRPITGSADFMYQNTTFIPLISASGEVTHLCVLVYDVTDTAINKLNLEQLNEKLARISQIDGLTNLFNRSHWERCFQLEYKRWIRSQHKSCLVMLDIDHFKRVNDSYGHVVGDEVIRDLAENVIKEVRETDITGRYGGEEFAVLLVDTPLENALVFAERLRKKISESKVEYKGNTIQYTVSLGVAEVSEEMKTYESWIEAADNALYKSKENGRNQVNLYKASA